MGNGFFAEFRSCPEVQGGAVALVFVGQTIAGKGKGAQCGRDFCGHGLNAWPCRRPIRVKPFDPVRPRAGDCDVAKVPAKVGDRPSADKGQPSGEIFGQAPERRCQTLRHHDRIRRRSNVDKRTVEIEEQGNRLILSEVAKRRGG